MSPRGLWSRRKIKRVEGSLVAVLEPGERLRTAFFASRRVYLFSGRSPLVNLTRNYFLAASESRLALLESSRWRQSPRRLLFMDALSGMSISKYERARWRSGVFAHLVIERQTNGERYDLAVHRIYRAELETLVSLVRAAR